MSYQILNLTAVTGKSAKLDIFDMGTESLLVGLTDIDENNQVMVSEITNGIKDAQRQVINKINTIFTKLGKNRSSEYVQWYRKNNKMIHRVEGMEYGTLVEQEISYPSGMVANYPEVMQAITDYHAGLTIEKVLGNYAEVLDSVMISIAQGSDSCERRLATATAKLTALVRKSTGVASDIDKMFNTEDSVQASKPFGKAFGNMAELTKFREQLEKADEFVTDAVNLSKQFARMEIQLDTVTKYITDTDSRRDGDQVPSSKFVNGFAAYLKAVDDIIVSYGKVITRTMAITHNTVFVYTGLGSKFS